MARWTRKDHGDGDAALLGRQLLALSLRSIYVLTIMAATNASPRGQRAAILASKLGDLTGFCLAVDCLRPQCRRERTFAAAELAEFYGGDRTVSEVLRRMRYSDEVAAAQ